MSDLNFSGQGVFGPKLLQFGAGFQEYQYRSDFAAYQNFGSIQKRLPAGAKDEHGRGIGGQFSTNLQLTQSDGEAIGELLRGFLKQNYIRENIKQDTGTLFRAVSDSAIAVKADKQLLVSVRIADYQRERPGDERKGIRASSLSTLTYGPFVFFGRGAIHAEGRQRLALQNSRGVFRYARQVSAAPAHNIFVLDSNQQTDLNRLVQGMVTREAVASIQQAAKK